MVERLLGVDQARKAGDVEAEKVFKELDNPHHIKAHFRKIKWKNMKREEYDMRVIMREAHYAKFSQNEDAKSYLLKTGDLPILEGTRSKYWGIGLDLKRDTDKILNVGEWNSDFQNHCGKSIMHARQKIRDEQLMHEEEGQ